MEILHRRLTWLRVISFILILGAWLYTYLKWPHLPEKIPAHFGFFGKPTRWVDANLFNWFLLPGIGVFLNFFVIGIFKLSLSSPDLINFTKDEHYKLFKSMTEEERQPLYKFMEANLYFYMIMVNLVWIVLQMTTYNVAIERWQGVPLVVPGLILAMVVLPLALIPTYNKTMNRLLKR